MENKNFMIFVLVMLLGITMYNQYFVLPKQQQEKARQEAIAKEQGLAAPAAATPGASAAVSRSASQTVAVPASTPKSETFYSFSTTKANIQFSSKGAGIKEYTFKDVAGDINLTPYEGEGFYATLPALDFELVKQTEDEVAFRAQADAVEINKTYKFNENGINNLKLTFKNKGKKDQTLMPFYYAFGPGLASVKSEMSENEAHMNAAYIFKEEGTVIKSIKLSF